jgi:hypothetical protein
VHTVVFLTRAGIHEQKLNPSILESLYFSRGRNHKYRVDSNNFVITR